PTLTSRSSALKGLDVQTLAKEDNLDILSAKLRVLEPTVRERLVTSAVAGDQEAFKQLELVLRKLNRDHFHTAFHDATFAEMHHGDFIVIRGRPTRFGIYRINSKKEAFVEDIQT